MRNYEISEKRLIDDIEAIAGWSESDPAAGYNRPTFSPSWAAAREYIIAE